MAMVMSLLLSSSTRTMCYQLANYFTCVHRIWIGNIEYVHGPRSIPTTPPSSYPHMCTQISLFFQILAHEESARASILCCVAAGLDILLLLHCGCVLLCDMYRTLMCAHMFYRCIWGASNVMYSITRSWNILYVRRRRRCTCCVYNIE